MGDWTTIADHADRLAAVVPSQFRDKPRIKALIAAIGTVVQAVEDDVAALVAADLDTATGAMLDRYAALVGEPRGVLATDADLRRFVKARILANRAKGGEDDLVEVAALVFDVDVTAIDHVAEPPLALTITAEIATASGDDLVRRILRTIDAARPAGVRLRVVEVETPGFRFGGDGAETGFGVGLLARYLGG